MEDEVIEKLKNNPEYLLRVCQGLEELRKGNKEDIRQSQIEAFEGGNKVVADLNKYLFSVATIVIPIIFSLTTIKEIRQILDQRSALLIKLSIISLFSSLFFGFFHMISEYNFFKIWLQNTEKKLKKWSSVSFWPGAPIPSKIKEYINEYETIKSQVDEIGADIERESSKINLILQAVFWSIGVLFITSATFYLLP